MTYMIDGLIPLEKRLKRRGVILHGVISGSSDLLYECAECGNSWLVNACGRKRLPRGHDVCENGCNPRK